MNTTRLVGLVFLTIFVCAFLGACSSTNMTNLWMDEEGIAPPVDDILIIALDRNPEMRRTWKDALSAEFQAQGLVARPSYQLFPADLPDSQQVAVVIRRDNHDAALVAHRISVITNAEPDGGYRDTAPGSHADYWRRGYSVAQSAATQPINYGKEKDNDEKVRYQLDLARANGRLLWTGQTVAIDPKDAEKLRVEVAGQVVPELQKRKIVMKD
jgi:hypothetical protein